MAFLNPPARKARKDLGNFGKRFEAEIELHQRFARRRAQPERLEREIEGVAGHLPEVGVAVLQAAQPSVLELLVAPERRQRRALVLGNVGCPRGRRSEVEQRAIGVENTGANALKTLGPRGRHQRAAIARASCPSRTSIRF
jgi:hypothetical protein